MKGELNVAIHVVLIDANSNSVVTFELEASMKLDVVVLESDFNNEDDKGWTQEEFESHETKEHEGKRMRPLLTRDLQVTPREGYTMIRPMDKTFIGEIKNVRYICPLKKDLLCKFKDL